MPKSSICHCYYHTLYVLICIIRFLLYSRFLHHIMCDIVINREIYDYIYIQYTDNVFAPLLYQYDSASCCAVMCSTKDLSRSVYEVRLVFALITKPHAIKQPLLFY